MRRLLDEDDVIDALNSITTITGRGNAKLAASPIVALMVGMFEDMIKALPSAEPRIGKWVPHIEISREYVGPVLMCINYDYWFCDACGYQVENGQPMYNFCPHCGADMRGEQDE